MINSRAVDLQLWKIIFVFIWLNGICGFIGFIVTLWGFLMTFKSSFKFFLDSPIFTNRRESRTILWSSNILWLCRERSGILGYYLRIDLFEIGTYFHICWGFMGMLKKWSRFLKKTLLNHEMQHSFCTSFLHKFILCVCVLRFNQKEEQETGNKTRSEGEGRD